MMLTLRALAALLDYPTPELQIHIGEVRSALHSEAVLPAAVLRRLEPLLRSFETEDLLDVQAAYSALFDQSRSLSLHLFEHVHGDGRERGQAMIDLGEEYIARGFLIERQELPDFLPLFLEFLSCQPPAEIRDWLGQPAHVLTVLEQRLAERDSPYAAIFQGLLEIAAVQPDPEAVAELQDRIRHKERKSVDQEWEEAPVDFSAPIQEGGATGVIARLKAARDAISSVRKG